MTEEDQQRLKTFAKIMLFNIPWEDSEHFFPTKTNNNKKSLFLYIIKLNCTFSIQYNSLLATEVKGNWIVEGLVANVYGRFQILSFAFQRHAAQGYANWKKWISV